MQKSNNQNPFADTNETTLDRVRFYFHLIDQLIFFFRKNVQENVKNMDY